MALGPYVMILLSVVLILMSRPVMVSGMSSCCISRMMIVSRVLTNVYLIEVHAKLLMMSPGMVTIISVVTFRIRFYCEPGNGRRHYGSPFSFSGFETSLFFKRKQNVVVSHLLFLLSLVVGVSPFK